MSHLVLILALSAATAPALAQTDPHAAHHMPAAPAPAPAHAEHDNSGHGAPPWADAPDEHAGHEGHSAAPAVAEPTSAPQAPKDFAAERFYDPKVMAAARAQLQREHGDIRWSQVMLETAERRLGDGDGYGWEGRASFGGDINRLVLKSEGEGDDHSLEAAELQALYARTIGPYFNLQAGLRHDFKPGPSRTYAALGVEGLAPYWFEVGATAFLSEKGDLSARFEASYDLRVTQRLILEPRAEIELQAQDVPELGEGAGLSSAEVGLRLRYAIRQEFAPYIGLMHERKFGQTADYARVHGEDPKATRFVVGLRAWF
ncbi:copper resistance protein B [Caulobacter sp. 73W]|uniref:Copper resistance protein B n=1 Tax=Caulobacter sp. 73W TaxID=3161137 RepID=A0AB39KUD8_9CAUL